MRRTNKIVVPIHIKTQVPVSAPFSQVSEQYLRSKERAGCSTYTVIHERDNLRAISKNLPTDADLQQMQSSDLEELVFDVMRKQGLKASTITGRIKTLCRLCEYAMEHGLITHNPASLVQKMKIVVEDIPSFSNEQIRELLTQPDCSTFTGLRDKTLMCLLLDTGIRLRELEDLEVSQVDLKSRRIRTVKGKNGKVEDIPISTQMATQFKLYFEHRGDSNCRSLFITIDDRPLHRRTIQENIAEYGVKAGITDVRVSPHTFRHTFAKHYITNGGDAFSLRRLMRHSTMDMVNRYVHLWGHELEKFQEKFSPLNNL